jgi:hypothetical protein
VRILINCNLGKQAKLWINQDFSFYPEMFENHSESDQRSAAMKSESNDEIVSNAHEERKTE